MTGEQNKLFLKVKKNQSYPSAKQKFVFYIQLLILCSLPLLQVQIQIFLLCLSILHTHACTYVCIHPSPPLSFFVIYWSLVLVLGPSGLGSATYEPHRLTTQVLCVQAPFLWSCFSFVNTYFNNRSVLQLSSQNRSSYFVEWPLVDLLNSLLHAKGKQLEDCILFFVACEFSYMNL